MPDHEPFDGTVPDLSQEVEELAALRYQVTSLDGYKDRECHWSVETTWSYGGPATYTAFHNGYNDEAINKTFSTYRAALVYLRQRLDESLRREWEWANRVLSDPEERKWSEREAKATRGLLKDRYATKEDPR